MLFLDDLQWADFASLELLRHLATHPDTPPLLLIGAYRDNEVSPSHPLALALAEVRKVAGRLVDIHLGPLSPPQTRQLVADALPGASDGLVVPLSELVQAKTGDVVYIYTGWQELWQDPDVTGAYYSQGPGLAPDAVKLLAEKAIVAIGMDVPFIDAVNPGQLQGQSPPPANTPPGLPFFSHHYALTKAGIHLMENVRLRAMAEDKTWLSCTLVLALRERGGSGSPVRPVAYGPPRN